MLYLYAQANIKVSLDVNTQYSLPPIHYLLSEE